MIIPLLLGFGSEVSVGKSFGVGAIAIVVLFGAMIALIAFGGGREHS